MSFNKFCSIGYGAIAILILVISLTEIKKGWDEGAFVYLIFAILNIFISVSLTILD